MAGLITARRDNALLFVGLNRPEKRNAIHRELLLELVDVIAAADAERDVRAIILYVEEPVFSARDLVTIHRGRVHLGSPPRPFRRLVRDPYSSLFSIDVQVSLV